MSSTGIEARVEGRVGVLSLDAATSLAPADLMSALEEGARVLLAHEAVDALVLVLDGDPPLPLESGSAAELVQHARRVQRFLDELRRSGRVLVAAVGGRLEAAGLDLALAAHLVVASEDCRLVPCGPGEGRLTGFGGFQRLATRSGVPRALLLALQGEALDARAAREAGLVELIVPAGEHLRGALDLAERCIAERAPALMRALLEASCAAPELGLEDALELEAQLAGLVAASRAVG